VTTAEAGDQDDIHQDETHRQGLAALALGAVGVVYGDIGTSPIYAFREALRATGVGPDQPAGPKGSGPAVAADLDAGPDRHVKYVFALLRADNRGEGGILALYTLVRLAIGAAVVPVLLLAIAGAALFAGDAAITPAISVLSAVEGAELVLPALAAFVLPSPWASCWRCSWCSAMARRGWPAVRPGDGAVVLTLAALGLWHMTEEPAVLAALEPRSGACRS
jgi:KUP system potassium uptake protein